MEISTSNLVAIMTVGVNVCDTLSRSVGQTNRKLYGGLSAFEMQTRSSAIAEGPCNASRQLKSCQLPCNSSETNFTTSPEQIEVMKL